MSLIPRETDYKEARFEGWKMGHIDGKAEGYRAGRSETLREVSHRAPWYVRRWLVREGFYRAERDD
jgi:hypothetical protein